MVVRHGLVGDVGISDDGRCVFGDTVLVRKQEAAVVVAYAENIARGRRGRDVDGIVMVSTTPAERKR